MEKKTFLVDALSIFSIVLGAFFCFRFSLSPLHFFFADDWALLYNAEFGGFTVINTLIPHLTYGDRPMRAFFSWVVYIIFALNNVLCHGSLLAVHNINSILLFSIFKKIFRSSTYALCGSVLFSVYMVGDACIIWFGDPADLMAGTFTLLTLFFYLKEKTGFLLLSAACYWLAMRSKEITIPLRDTYVG